MLSEDAIKRAAQAWPKLDIDGETFSAYVASCMVEAPDDAGLAELYLACGCSRGDPTAMALFDARYLGAVPAALAHMQLGPDAVDEVRQLVRHKLLVAEPGARPKLDEYAGRGRLHGLIQVIAVRLALDGLRKNKRHAPDAEMSDLPSPELDPELAYMKESYRAAFKAAFEEAMRALSSRDRNFLRLHHFGGLTVEQAGEVYGVHRATATRWLAQIRTQVLTETRRRMGEALSLPARELDSVMDLVQSRLDVSVQRMLVTHEGAADAASPPPNSREP